MTKSITILGGSPHKYGNTNALTEIVKKRLNESPVEVDSFSLYDMNILPCKGCRACQKDWIMLDCVQNDDFSKIANSIMRSSLIIFSTPIYSWYCTPPMKSLLDRLVYAFNMYYGEKKGPSLWEGKSVALITTCGYPPEKGADLFEEGMKRYCRHSKLNYLGMLCEHHKGYNTVFMDDEKAIRAEAFGEWLLEKTTWFETIPWYPDPEK